MHSKNVLLRFAGLVVAAVLATLSVSAVTTSSSAALPVPFTQRTVKVANAYQQAQCSIVINGSDFNGHETGYIDAQSQANLFGASVKSTTINCYAYEATFSTLVGYFSYSGTGPTLLNTRKNGAYPVSSTYHICIVLTTNTYSSGSFTSSRCA